MTTPEPSSTASTGGLYLEKRHEIERHPLASDHLRAAALHPDDSRAPTPTAWRKSSHSNGDCVEVTVLDHRRPAPHRSTLTAPCS
jgi:Domain of unknown function (DUF397)